MKQPVKQQLLSEKEFAEYVGMGYSTVLQMRLKGEGPPVVRFGVTVRYDLRDIEAWIEANKRAPGSETEPTIISKIKTEEWARKAGTPRPRTKRLVRPVRGAAARSAAVSA